jgi:hypothetical protein
MGSFTECREVSAAVAFQCCHSTECSARLLAMVSIPSAFSSRHPGRRRRRCPSRTKRLETQLAALGCLGFPLGGFACLSRRLIALSRRRKCHPPAPAAPRRCGAEPQRCVRSQAKRRWLLQSPAARAVAAAGVPVGIVLGCRHSSGSVCSSLACWRTAIRTRETPHAKRRVSARRSSWVSASSISQDWATAARVERG